MTLPETIPPPLTIQLFGPMQILVHGRPIPRLRSRKGHWLLALLSLRHGRRVEREWIAGTLWPDLAMSQALANLRPVLSELRVALGDQNGRLQSPERQTLALDLADAKVDLIEFDACIASKQIPRLELSISLYTGSLLEGCEEEWVFQDREARQQECVEALLTLGEFQAKRQEFSRAIGLFQQAAGIDPWRDAARRGWMEALANCGDRNAALQVYRSFVEALRSDPHATPDPKTTELYQRLRSEMRSSPNKTPLAPVEPASEPKISGYLPHALSDLIGREDESAEVASLLRRSRLVTLTGLGGIGKTRLSLEVAQSAAQEFPDGVWLVSLEALTEGGQALRQIASVLNIKERSDQQLWESVKETLVGKRLLIVLDNCEHLVQECSEIVTRFLREFAGIRILATSRTALDIVGEVIWSVPPLAVPVPEHLPLGRSTMLKVIASYEGVRLFSERAQAVRREFSVTADNALTVAHICQRLEGIPLALELVAARVKSMSVEQVFDRLNAEFGLLSGAGSRLMKSRQQTLRSTLDWSFDLLSELERTLLARLAVFSGWSLEAAEAVCSGNGMDREQIADLLGALVDKSLIAFEERDGSGRYRLLEIVRQYASEKLMASGETEQLRARHRDWLMALATEADANWIGPDNAMWRQRLDADSDNLRLTLNWGETPAVDPQTQLMLTQLLWRYWVEIGELSQGRRYLATALQLDTQRPGTRSRAQALNGAAVLAARQGDYDGARKLHAEGLSVWRALGDPRGIAASLGNLGNVALHQGDYEASFALLSESVELRRELGDARGISWSIESLAALEQSRGNYRGAMVQFEECFRICQELGDDLGAAQSSTNVGTALEFLGEYVQARISYDIAMEIFTQLGVKYGIACITNSLGNISSLEGDFATAAPLNERGRALYEELGDRQGMALADNYMGNTAYLLGDLAEAERRYTDSVEACAQIGYREGAEWNLRGLAAVAMSRNDPRKAARLWGAAESLRGAGVPFPPNQLDDYDRLVAQAKASLDEAAFAEAWEAGRVELLEEAVSKLVSESRFQRSGGEIAKNSFAAGVLTLDARN